MITVTHELLIVWENKALKNLEHLKDLNDKSRKEDRFKRVEEVKTLLFYQSEVLISLGVQYNSGKDDMEV